MNGLICVDRVIVVYNDMIGVSCLLCFFFIYFYFLVFFYGINFVYGVMVVDIIWIWYVKILK